MLQVCFELTAGRYHGTRWGTHVNEADVDWPPSPWRLLRAFLAVGYTRLGWSEGKLPAEAVELIESLSAVTPTYYLPPAAVVAHTRHYLPLYKEGKSAKVLDAFVRVPREHPCFSVAYDATLSEGAVALLDRVLAHLSYLGRAESWVEVHRVESTPVGLLPCDPEQREDHVPIELICPLSAEEYAIWRQGALEHALASELQRQIRSKVAKGKPPPDKLSASQRRRVASTIPQTLSEALSIDTGTIRKQGWSRPPGSRTVRFWRPRTAVDAAPSGRSRPRVADRPLPTLALFQVTSDTVRSPVLPPLRTAMRQAQWLHQILLSRAPNEGEEVSILSGVRDGSPRSDGHRHTHILPLALGYEGQRAKLSDAPTDHVLLWAPEGYPPEIQGILMGLRRDRLWAGRDDGAADREVQLALVGMGSAPDFDAFVPAVGVGRVWVSRTPWVPPRYVKPRGRNGLEGQIRGGLAHRGLPEPVSVEVETGDLDTPWRSASSDGPRTSSWRRFDLERYAGKSVKQRPRQRLTFGVRLTFAEPVRGPICLGYGSHFGLGRFVPEFAE
jgi:CRISPR-associated protein Csb2